MQAKPLNLDEIKKATKGDVLKDDKERGLTLRVRNKKTFYFYYRTGSGQQRKPRIGDWPNVTLDKAREVSRQWRAIVTQGGDPSRDRQDSRKAPTVSELRDRYRTDHAPTKKPRSRRLDEDNWTSAIIPALGKKRVPDVTTEDVRRFMRSLSKTPVKANRCLTLLRKAFNLAIMWKHRTDNPTIGVVKYTEHPKERYLEPEEFSALWSAFDQLQERYPAGIASLRILMLTGARLSEIVQARREWLRDGTLHLPDSKTNEPKKIKFPKAALEVIAAAPDTDGWLCGIGIRPTPAWKAACKLAKIPNLRIHDLRHNFASVALANGYTLSQIGKLLGHKSPTTTQRYAHLVTALRDKAMEDVAESILRN